MQQVHLEALEDGIYDLMVDNLRPIQDQNQTLVRLVNDLRTLPLADSRELTLERTKTDFKQLVERTVRRFEPKMVEKDVDLQISFPEGPAMIQIDPQRVEQIIPNLLSNALRHTILVEKIELDLEVAKDQVHLTIRDQGGGIPEGEIPFISERFYKSSKTRHQGDGGTGLGLSISQKLAQAHGGSIKAHNHPEGGAVFSLTLPA